MIKDWSTKDYHSHRVYPFTHIVYPYTFGSLAVLVGPCESGKSKVLSALTPSSSDMARVGDLDQVSWHLPVLYPSPAAAEAVQYLRESQSRWDDAITKLFTNVPIHLRRCGSAQIEVVDIVSGRFWRVFMTHKGEGSTDLLNIIFNTTAAPAGLTLIFDDFGAKLDPHFLKIAWTCVLDAVARGVQVILATHNPSVISWAPVEALTFVTRRGREIRLINGATVDALKTASKLNRYLLVTNAPEYEQAIVEEESDR